MKKQELHSLVQECIAEVLDEKYSEFQRVDKGSKDVDAKDKGEEDVYGAGYAAGEKAAKAKYKKLAEAYKKVTSTIYEAEKPATPMSSDAKNVITVIEKVPMLMQKLKMLNTREELESVFDYLFTKINPQLSKNITGIKTAAAGAAQKLNEEALPQYAKKIADQHNLMLLQQPLDKPQLYQMWKKEKGSFGAKAGVMTFVPNTKTVNVLSSDEKIPEAVFVQFKADKGGDDQGFETKTFAEDGQKGYFKNFTISDINETTLEEAEGVTADAVAVEKAIKDKKIDPAQVKAAAEKAMKGDSTELALLMVNAGAF
jgi:hypothetical protein